jgi:hypothetical protein
VDLVLAAVPGPGARQVHGYHIESGSVLAVAVSAKMEYVVVGLNVNSRTRPSIIEHGGADNSNSVPLESGEIKVGEDQAAPLGHG